MIRWIIGSLSTALIHWLGLRWSNHYLIYWFIDSPVFHSLTHWFSQSVLHGFLHLISSTSQPPFAQSLLQLNRALNLLLFLRCKIFPAGLYIGIFGTSAWRMPGTICMVSTKCFKTKQNNMAGKRGPTAELSLWKSSLVTLPFSSGRRSQSASVGARSGQATVLVTKRNSTA